MRTMVRLVALFAAAIALASAALAVTTRGDLDRELDNVAAEWERARPTLDDRYAALATANNAVRDHGGSTRAVVGELDSALRHWDRAITRSDLAAQVGTANELEGLARRLRASVDHSPSLANDAATLAFVAFDQRSIATEPLNDRIASYMQRRGSGARAIVADLFDHGEMPEFAV